MQLMDGTVVKIIDSIIWGFLIAAFIIDIISWKYRNFASTILYIRMTEAMLSRMIPNYEAFVV